MGCNRGYNVAMRISAGLVLTLAAMTTLLGGCYERVVSERPFAGMAATRTPTAADYTAATAEQVDRVNNANKKPFDPLGDLIFKPIGGVAQGIGNAFGGKDDPDDDDKKVEPPARPATSPGDVAPPPAPPGRSIFDTAP